MFKEVCVILLLNILFYLKTLGYKYASDDLPSYQRGKNPNKWKHWYLVLEGHEKSTPVTDHAITILLHSLVCIGIYLGFGKTDISFLAAILFSVNPSNNQGSIWISGRGYVLSALGMVWSLTIPYLAPLFLLICTYSNAGFLSPIALIGSNYPWLVLLLPPLWWFHSKRFHTNVKAKMDREMFTEDKAIKLQKIPLVIKTFGFYATLAVIPFQNSFYHSFLQSSSGSGVKKAYTMKDRFFFIGLAILGTMAWYIFTHKWDMICFGMLWWCICIAPFLNFIRMNQEIAERYIYLPNVGLTIIAATLLITHPILIGVFITMYATRTWFLMDMYTDDYYLLEWACLLSPQSWFAWHVRGMKRWDNNSFQESVVIWTMARLLSPKEFKVNFNLATALMMSGHKEEAIKFLQIAEDNIPAGQTDCYQVLEDWKKGKLAILL